MIPKLNLTFPTINQLTVPSPKTLGVLACGSGAVALWHRIDRRNDSENVVRNSVIQTIFLSLGSMFGMLRALSGTEAPSTRTKAAATLCAGAAAAIPAIFVAARTLGTGKEEPIEQKLTVTPLPTSTSVSASANKFSEEVSEVLKETLEVDKQ